MTATMTTMTTMKLYEIADARDILDGFLAESEGEVTPELEALLTELQGQAQEKIERVALYVREQDAQAAAIKTEIDRLTAMKKARERAADGLKAYLLRHMQGLGIDKVNGLLCTVAIQKTAPSVKGEVTDDVLYDLLESDETKHLVRYIPERVELDKRACLDEWKQHGADGMLPAGLTVESGVSLRIR